jgi:PAS domain S-box-containing protein
MSRTWPDFASLDSVRVPVIVVDRECTIVGWNSACAELTGFGPREVLHKRAWEFLSPVGAHTRQTIAAQLLHGATVRFESAVKTNSTAPAHLLWSSSVVRGARDQPEGAVLTGVDAAAAAHEREAASTSFAALLERAPDGIFVTDVDGRCVEVNHAACRMLGYEHDELVGKPVRELFRPEDIARLRQTSRELAQGRAHVGEWKLRRKDGSYADVEISANTLPDGRGQGCVRDVTQRKAQEAERDRLLKEADADRHWLRTVVDTVPLGLILFGRDGTIASNRGSETLLGMSLSPAEGSKQYASQILYPDGTPVPFEQMPSTRALRTGESTIGGEYLVRRADGSQISVLSSAAAIRNDDGEIIGAIGAFQDVSERMAAARAVRANERLLNCIFEILPVGVWIADESGRIVRVNPAGERIWGGARYVAISEFGAYEGWWADSGKRIKVEDWAITRALERNETSLGELIRIHGFDGAYRTIINSAAPLHDEAGKFVGAVAVNEDVTHLRETEDALRRAVHARDELLGIVAHDVRTPLSGILLQLDLLQALPQAERGDDRLAAIRRQALRIDRLIEDLLDLARIDDGGLSIRNASTPAHEILVEALEAGRALGTSRAIALSLTAPDELPEVWTDRERVLQVFENLIANAIKFTPPGGRVELGGKHDDGQVQFWVSDTGVGISAENLPHLFDRFWQVNRGDRRGAGLGLAIVKGIVASLGGRVWVESRPGAGSTFHFTLNVAKGTELRPGEAAAAR